MVVAPPPGHRRAGAPGLVRRGRPSGGCRADGLDDTWQADVFAVPSIVDEEDVWAATLEATADIRARHSRCSCAGTTRRWRASPSQSGFAMTDELSGTAWMDADRRPPVAQVDGFAIVDRVTRADRPHPMIARNGELVEPRLRQCSLYDPTLDLAVEDVDGRVAGYALFWFDHTTLVGLLEPMRVEDEYQRRGLARMLLTNGLDRLAPQRRTPSEGRLRDRRRPQSLPRRRLRSDVYRSAAHSTGTA